MSNNNRRDHKGRKLWQGESQESNGRYRYRYTNALGETKVVYSWRLTESDVTPKGKRMDISLREKEKVIARDLCDEVDSDRGNMTVFELAELYTEQKRGVKHTTRYGYKTVLNILKKGKFGKKKISSIKNYDARKWLIQLQDAGRSYSSIHNIRGVLRPAFRLAEDNDWIRKNPFNFGLASVIVNDSVTRQALTREQEGAFLNFIRNDDHFCKYYDGIFILFKTGLRISEFCGLTFADIDLENNFIKVDHQLQRTSNMEYIIVTPKTDSGTRKVPMSAEVNECFRRIIKNRKKPKHEPRLKDSQGKVYTEFLFLDKNDMPMVALHWEKYFQHIREKRDRMGQELMPKVTPHVCRHTFCSNMAKAGVNPKKLQYIMGHSEIGVTLNTYTHFSYEDLGDEMEKVCGKQAVVGSDL